MKRKKNIPKSVLKALSVGLLALALLLTSGCQVITDLIGRGTEEPVGTDVTVPTPETRRPGPDETSAPAQTGSIYTMPPQPATSEPSPDDSVPETTAAPAVLYPDPLTGLMQEKDVSKVRPVSIVIDNVSAASPQSGISRADILIECMVEGGISRLMMITNDYESNEVYGPVRSTRPYLLSMGRAFNTLMVGAGYSPQAYTMIEENKLEYLDGTHDKYALSGFFRDVKRKENNGYEHSLMITGNGIVALAAIHGYAIDRKNVSYAFSFSPEGREAVLTGGSAYHTVLTYSAYQQVQLIYSSSAGTYYRYSFGDKAHLDAETGEQLNFKNVFILFAKTEPIPDDDAGRLNIELTGTGTGYYLTGGHYTSIRWTRTDDASGFTFTNDSGMPIVVNRGKTFISVMSDTAAGTSAVDLNYKVN